MEPDEARLKFTVKVRPDPSLADWSLAEAVGAASVFTTVPVALLVTEFAVIAKLKVRFGVKVESVAVGTVTVLEVSPAAKVSVPDVEV